MKLTLHHLRRLRRKLRRVMSDPYSLRAIEEWTGHRLPPPARKPPDLMKAAFYILLLIVLVVAIIGLSSCSTVETKTTVTDPVTGLVTVTESKTTAPDAGSVAALSTTAQAFAPRAVIIHPAK